VYVTAAFDTKIIICYSKNGIFQKIAEGEHMLRRALIAMSVLLLASGCASIRPERDVVQLDQTVDVSNTTDEWRVLEVERPRDTEDFRHLTVQRHGSKSLLSTMVDMRDLRPIAKGFRTHVDTLPGVVLRIPSDIDFQLGLNALARELEAAQEGRSYHAPSPEALLERIATSLARFEVPSLDDVAHVDQIDAAATWFEDGFNPKLKPEVFSLLAQKVKDASGGETTLTLGDNVRYPRQNSCQCGNVSLVVTNKGKKLVVMLSELLPIVTKRM